MERTAAEHRAAVQRATDVRQYTVENVTSSARDRALPVTAPRAAVAARDDWTDGVRSLLIPANEDRRIRTDPEPEEIVEDGPPASWLR